MVWARCAACSDLMSYLLFTPKYTKELIDIGYRDANNRIDEIEDFLIRLIMRTPNSRARQTGPASRDKHPL